MSEHRKYGLGGGVENTMLPPLWRRCREHYAASTLSGMRREGVAAALNSAFDDTGQDLFSFSVDSATRMFHFEIQRKS